MYWVFIDGKDGQLTTDGQMQRRVGERETEGKEGSVRIVGKKLVKIKEPVMSLTANGTELTFNWAGSSR